MSSLVVNTNISALDAYNNLNQTDEAESSAISKLSSGLQIQTAADGPAQYVVSQALESQSNGYQVAMSNAQNGVSLIQTAAGALNQISSLLQQMNQLALNSANGATNDSTSFNANQQEFAALQNQINQIASTTQFGQTALLDGSFSNAVLQVGAFDNSDQQITLNISATTIGALGIAAVGVGTVSVTGATALATAAVNGTVAVTGSALATASVNGTVSVAGTSALVTATAAATIDLTLSVDGTSYNVTVSVATGDTASDIEADVNTALTAATITDDGGVLASLNASGDLVLTTQAASSPGSLSITGTGGDTTLGLVTGTSAEASGLVTLDVKVGGTAYTIGVTESNGETAASIAAALSTAIAAASITADGGLTASLNGSGDIVLTTVSAGDPGSIQVTNSAFGLATQSSASGASTVVTLDVSVGGTAYTIGVTETNGESAASITAALSTALAAATITADGGLTASLNNSGDIVLTTVATTGIGSIEVTNSAFGLATQSSASTSTNGIVSVSSQTAAENAISAVQAAISTVASIEANVGATQNQLTAVVANLTVGQQNLEAAYSSMVDVNFAQETTTFSTDQILMQSGTAMLAQAQQTPSLVLKLLQG